MHGVTLNGEPISTADLFKGECEHASDFCFEPDDREILPSKYGMVCSFHYDLQFQYWNYDFGDFYSSVDDFVRVTEARMASR